MRSITAVIQHDEGVLVLFWVMKGLKDEFTRTFS